MLRIIFTRNTLIRDGVIAHLGLHRNPTELSVNFQVYQKTDWILIYSLDYEIDAILPTILENWDPDRIYLPYIGRTVDMMHEIGDIILPNVFMSYHSQVAEIDPDSEVANMPSIEARFLEIFPEQKDYYVEDYGLSVGGIVVDHVPHDEALNTALMMTYEGDIFIQESLDPAYTVTTGDLIPALILCGVVEGKKGSHENGTPEQMVIRNMITTIRLTEEDDA